MSYKTILVHLDGSKRRTERLDLALRLADRDGAHLIGLFGSEPLQPPIAPEAAPMLISDMVTERNRLVERVKDEFLAKVRNAGYTGRSTWRATPLGDGFSALQFHAKYADLVVAGQPGPDDEQAVSPSFAHDLVRSIGRPVLYVPFAGRFDDCGKRVLVAWNASREAARAVKDALPLLQAAQTVDVVTFNPEAVFPADEELPDPDMGSYLARHGVKTNVATQPLGEVDVGSAILSYTADNAIDLIVMGAYSHSRVRELVLGGATRSLFESMTVPTLMAR